jgi:hypothetical protein
MALCVMITGFTVKRIHTISSFDYSKSFLFGFLEASLDKKPNAKRDTNKVTVV